MCGSSGRSPSRCVDTVSRRPGRARAAGELWRQRRARRPDGKRIASELRAELGDLDDWELRSTRPSPVAGRQPSRTRRGRRRSARRPSEENLRVGQRVGLATRTGVKQVTIVGIFEFGDVASIGGASDRHGDRCRRCSVVRARGRGDRRVVAAAEDGVAARSARGRIGEVTSSPTSRSRPARPTPSRRPTTSTTRSAASSRRCCSHSPARRCSSARSSSSTPSRSPSPSARASSRCCGRWDRRAVRSSPRVAGEALIVGVVASGLGLLVGLGFAKLLGALFDAAGFGIPRAGMALAPRTIAVALGVGIGVTLLAALVPALRATRVTPVQALAGTSVPSRAPPAARAGSSGRRLRARARHAAAPACSATAPPPRGWARWPAARCSSSSASRSWRATSSGRSRRSSGWPLERTFHTPGRLARENAMRNPGRTATTSSALMVGLGLVVFVAVFAAGMKADGQRVVRPAADERPGRHEPEHRAAARTTPATRSPASPGSTRSHRSSSTRSRSTAKPSNADDRHAQRRASRASCARCGRSNGCHGGSDALLDRLTGTSAIVEEQFAKTHRHRDRR